MSDMFRDRLAQALREAGLNQSQLARAARVSRSAVSLWLSGGIETISSENIFAIARACHVDPEWLATGRLNRQQTRTKNMATQYSPSEQLAQKIERLAPELQAHLAALIEALEPKKAAETDRPPTRRLPIRPQ